MLIFSLLLPLLAFAEDCERILVESVQKNAVIFRAEQKPAVLEDDDSLEVGDRISTGEGALVELRLCDGSALRVGPKSKFKFVEAGEQETPVANELSAWAFELVKGSLLAVVVGEEKSDKVKVKVRTPSASLGVRGTEFLVENDEKEGTSLHTIEGEVLLGSVEDFESLGVLKGNDLVQRFESVVKSRKSRIAIGEKRAQKAEAFQLAELRQKKSGFLGRPLVRLARQEAKEKVFAASERRKARKSELRQKGVDAPKRMENPERRRLEQKNHQESDGVPKKELGRGQNLRSKPNEFPKGTKANGSASAFVPKASSRTPKTAGPQRSRRGK